MPEPINIASVLDEVVTDAQVASEVVEQYSAGDIKAGAALADTLLAIALKVIRAHEAVTGQPIDLSKLTDAPLIPEQLPAPGPGAPPADPQA